MAKKKKDKAKQAAKKERQELKQQKLNKKKAVKEAGEENIEEILQEFMKKEAAKTAITVEDNVPPPTSRANFTLTTLPNGEMILFGGEYFNGEINTVFNDLYRWNLEQQKWTFISSPNSPPPRCSHQAVVYRDHLYIFGGEFATADQFYHYRDLWRLDIKTNAWECIEAKGGPSPRSGHRMVVWRNYLVVYAGFYEAFRETKWYNDLFLFNFAEQKWKKIVFPVHKFIPPPRSGCQLAVHPTSDIIFMYGGYAKVKTNTQKTQGKTYTDMWTLNMAPVVKKHDPSWEKVSRKGHPPSPRSGATMTVYRNKAILFGGVFDEEGARHAIKSTFYNDMYSFDMDRKRWYQLQLRSKNKKEKKRRRKKDKAIEVEHNSSSEESDSEDNDSVEDEQERLMNQFGYVDHNGNIVYIEDEEEKTEPISILTQHNEECKEEETKEEEIIVKDTLAPPIDLPEVKEIEDAATEFVPAPLPRINPALTIRNHTLYIYGGVLEEGDREITLDDCWSLDLKKLDEWKVVLPGTMQDQEWKGETSDTEESSIASDDEDSEEEEYMEYQEVEDAEEELDEEKNANEEAIARVVEVLQLDDEQDESCAKKKLKKKKPKSNRRALRAEIVSLQEQLQLGDVNQTPAPGENLRDFFARTANYWAQQVAELPETIEKQLSIKDMKREGFSLAEKRYNELLPLLERLNVLEAEQKAAEEEAQQSKNSKRPGSSSKRR